MQVPPVHRSLLCVSEWVVDVDVDVDVQCSLAAPFTESFAIYFISLVLLSFLPSASSSRQLSLLPLLLL